MSKILIVEDNELNRRLFSDLLATRGHTILEADNGRAALDLVQTEQLDLILMDIQLPNISGLEITAQIRKMENIKQPRILAVSAFAMKQDAEKALAAGCDDYISKPIAIASFFATIDKNLSA